ncbi:myosin-binding protein 7-like [Salvia hispanica]|uniref:myosin-binding protein 7-like n=1 Tax=Salvia hispanica TaxID=49212 RepID=UPI00200910ED|nr:myosin-binding protein 7-like [Salvia hispanica]XP_047964773.1 myosin-binding protein 7-like [Salvia hispanica]
MDSVICLDHLPSVYYHFGFGFVALWNFKEISEIFALFLLISFGFKSFSSLWFPIDISRVDRSKKVIDPKLKRKSEGKHASVSERRRNCDSEVSALRKLVKMERRRADAALAEVERERAASATAAEEAMAMIQRLQREKNSIEMAANQQRRLSEAKHVHDEEVIQSLESLVWSYEAELGLLRQQLGGGVEESLFCLSP